MDVSLCLVLLQLTVAWSSGSGFRVEQPKYIEAVVNEPVTLTCTFTHPEISSLRDIDIRWRVRNYYTADIFRYLDNYTLKDFRGRIKFLGSPFRDKTGSIRLLRVREEDSNMYFCSVVILGEEYTGPGTVLSVQARTGSRERWVKQLGYQEAAENGSVILPCSFTYPDTYTPRDIHITWRVGGFHGTEIFDSSRNNALGEYRGRIEFLGSPLRNKTGSIRLHRLNGNDSNFYFCGVTILEDHGQLVGWQSSSGTFLSVRGDP
ncbi:paired immunoglobulin-like type 2 receptor beta isoform X2 [Mobula hypostoma]|uniref:paired immunoglobulin-like type 2 receptor beta isoform X2 n=1 Tax=Mobula hypostoma TaxID=723540 RepID=UPI002FC2C71A